ncbi:SdiA-regulated domain-containing protein [Nonlabens sp. YIK11]|uniref:SdiA-regulated domain-containing protein n=1 Tax=Nonlabens sp. YIK11 TaxID=1453349 RepID=UPI0006DC0024|nr:SdiA-regulated domain-containing protein [Nonlabens sp. YIK11]
MKNVKLTVALVVIGMVLVAVFAYLMVSHQKPMAASTNYEIVKTWPLQRELEEISGITWLTDNTIACIQDENGLIYIYDLAQGRVVDRINFAGDGDYEAIAVMDDDAFVMRSDGRLFKVARFRESEQKTTTYFQTNFTHKDDMESLALNANGDLLLTIPKQTNNTEDRKGIYEIDPQTKLTSSSPTIEIKINDSLFSKNEQRAVRTRFSPSDMAVHPQTGDFYLLEGVHPKLVVLDQKGLVKDIIFLDSKNFAQPEGIAISPTGRIYIANEGNAGIATIHEVIIKL